MNPSIVASRANWAHPAPHAANRIPRFGCRRSAIRP